MQFNWASKGVCPGWNLQVRMWRHRWVDSHSQTTWLRTCPEIILSVSSSLYSFKVSVVGQGSKISSGDTFYTTLETLENTTDLQVKHIFFLFLFLCMYFSMVQYTFSLQSQRHEMNAVSKFNPINHSNFLFVNHYFSLFAPAQYCSFLALWREKM